MPYVSFTDLRATSRLREVQDADDNLLTAWTDTAQGEIDQFCNRDFDFESGVAKQFWVTSPLIVVGKEVSNITSATVVSQSGTAEADVDLDTEFLVVPPHNRTIRFTRMSKRHQPYPIPPKLVTITADFGLATAPSEVQRVFKRLVDRIAVRSHEDDVLQENFAYAKQADGDGYEYDLADGTLRNLLRPEDRAQLWKWVSHGRFAA